MGWQSYVLPYETDAQLEALLDLCGLHNSSPPATNVFVRYHEGGEFQQIHTGEELVGPVTATFKKPYKRPRDGPTLGKALRVGNGGGRGCTFAFFTYHCRRLFSREWDAANGGLRIDAYDFHEALDKRLKDKKVIPQEGDLLPKRGISFKHLDESTLSHEGRRALLIINEPLINDPCSAGRRNRS